MCHLPPDHIPQRNLVCLHLRASKPRGGHSREGKSVHTHDRNQCLTKGSIKIRRELAQGVVESTVVHGNPAWKLWHYQLLLHCGRIITTLILTELAAVSACCDKKNLSSTPMMANLLEPSVMQTGVCYHQPRPQCGPWRNTDMNGALAPAHTTVDGLPWALMEDVGQVRGKRSCITNPSF